MSNILLSHAFRGEPPLKLSTDLAPVKLAETPDRLNRFVFSSYNKSRGVVIDDFRNGAGPEGNDRRTACHCFDHHQAERLGPVDWKQQRRSTSQESFLGGIIHLTSELNLSAVDL